MNYVVFGAGGTGGCIGGFLAKAGLSVTIIARGDHLAAMRRNGLAVRSARAGDFTLPVRACSAEEYGGSPDVIFVCVKSYSLGDAAEFVNRAARKDTLVIPILNGFGTGAVMQEKCPDRTILDGCIYIMSMIGEPGVILQPAPVFRIYFGFRGEQDRSLLPRARRVVGDLTEAGISIVFTEEILKEQLRKFSFVSPMGAAGVYLNVCGGDFKKDGAARDLFAALVREVVELGRAMGIVLPGDLLEQHQKTMAGLADDSTTSMQRDISRGHVSEFDGLVRRVARLALTYGVCLPKYAEIAAWGDEKGIR